LLALEFGGSRPVIVDVASPLPAECGAVATRRSSVRLEVRRPAAHLKRYGPVTITVADGPGNPRDYVAMYRVGEADGSFLSWRYLNDTQYRPAEGLTVGTVTLDVPTVSGSYEARFMSIDASGVTKRLVRSATIVVE